MNILQFIIDFYKEYLDTPEVLRTPAQSMKFWALTIAIIIVLLLITLGIVYIQATIENFKKKRKQNKISGDSDEIHSGRGE